MNFPAILQSLKAIDFQKLVCVELSRHSHRADKIIPAAIEFLRETELRLDARVKESAA